MLASVILDIVLAGIIVLGFFIGIKCGFIKIIAKPVRAVASLSIALGFSSGYSAKYVEPKIYTTVSSKLSDYLYTHCQNITPENASEELPTLLKISAAIFGIDINSFTPESFDSLIDSIVSTLTAPLVRVISLIISFLILFFISKLIFTLVFHIINNVFDSGVLGLPNKILGSIFSTAFAIILAWGLTAVFDFAVHSSLFSEVEWMTDFNGGPIYRLFKNLNPIDLLLGF